MTEFPLLIFKKLRPDIEYFARLYLCFIVQYYNMSTNNQIIPPRHNHKSSSRTQTNPTNWKIINFGIDSFSYIGDGNVNFSPWEVVSMALDPVWIAPIMLTVSVSPVSLWCCDHPPTWHQSEVSRRRTTRLHATLLSARSRELPQRETDGPSPSVTGLDWVNMLRWSRYYQVISKEGRNRWGKFIPCKTCIVSRIKSLPISTYGQCHVT